MAQAALKRFVRNAPDETVDWKRIAYLLQLSRALDAMEETRLVPEKKVLYQFSRARPRHGADPARPAPHRRRTTASAATTARARSCWRSASRSRTRWARRWARAGGYSRRARHRRRLQLSQPATAPRRCPCAAASARNTRRPPAGRRRSSITRSVLERRRPMTAPSASCSAATPRSRPTASGRR